MVLGGEGGVELTVDILLGIRFGHALREGLMRDEEEDGETIVSEEEDDATTVDEGEGERKIVLVTRRAEDRALDMAREDCKRHKVRLIHKPITNIV